MPVTVEPERLSVLSWGTRLYENTGNNPLPCTGEKWLVRIAVGKCLGIWLEMKVTSRVDGSRFGVPGR